MEKKVHETLTHINQAKHNQMEEFTQLHQLPPQFQKQKIQLQEEQIKELSSRVEYQKQINDVVINNLNELVSGNSEEKNENKRNQQTEIENLKKKFQESQLEVREAIKKINMLKNQLDESNQNLQIEKKQKHNLQQQLSEELIKKQKQVNKSENQKEMIKTLQKEILQIKEQFEQKLQNERKLYEEKSTKFETMKNYQDQSESNMSLYLNNENEYNSCKMDNRSVDQHDVPHVKENNVTLYLQNSTSEKPRHLIYIIFQIMCERFLASSQIFHDHKPAYLIEQKQLKYAKCHSNSVASLNSIKETTQKQNNSNLHFPGKIKKFSRSPKKHEIQDIINTYGIKTKYPRQQKNAYIHSQQMNTCLNNKNNQNSLIKNENFQNMQKPKESLLKKEIKSMINSLLIAKGKLTNEHSVAPTNIINRLQY